MQQACIGLILNIFAHYQIDHQFGQTFFTEKLGVELSPNAMNMATLCYVIDQGLSGNQPDRSIIDEFKLRLPNQEAYQACSFNNIAFYCSLSPELKTYAPEGYASASDLVSDQTALTALHQRILILQERN